MKKTALAFAILLLGAWMAQNYQSVVGHDEDGFIRFVLGTLFALIVLVRPKPRTRASQPPLWVYLAGGVAGTVLAVLGLIFRVNQFEWLGLLTLCGTCMMWALPRQHARDVAIALFVFYWIHPLPSQVFGPMRLMMQGLSIKGAEWLLHSLNIPAWADKLILYVGSRPVGVPEACSGMRTAVTVLLCTLGVTILLRFRWWHTVPFLVVGLLQVLLFNILRIAAFAYFVQRMPAEWGETFLHDTLGIFLLVTLLIVQLEASWWKYWVARRKRIKEGIKSGELERPDRGTILPSFFLRVRHWGWVPLLALIIIAGLALGIYKRRPAHRAAMIARGVEELGAAEPAKAEQAIRAALHLTPDDRELQTKLLRTLVVKRRDFAEALKVCETMLPPLSTFEVILKSWSLMALDRPEEAVALVEALPPAAHNLPGVAIVRAEYAASRDEADVVIRNVAIACRTHLFVERIRALFPYLAEREQWQAIVDSDNHAVPYTEIGPAILAIHAYLRLNINGGAAQAMEQALAVWPDDSRFLDQIYELAMRVPAGRWETAFGRVLQQNLSRFDARTLSAYMDDSFRLVRPDLAWLVYTELHKRDPNDPVLTLAVARYANEWFVFRKHQLGFQSDSPFAVTDIQPLLARLGHMEPLSGLIQRIPLVDELMSDERNLIRTRYLNTCLAELERRERAGTLTQHQELLYPTALALALRYDEARRRLDQIAAKYPEKKRDVLLQHALYYGEEDRWGDVYETLRQYREFAGLTVLRAELMMANAAMNLGCGIHALQTVVRAQQVFPGTANLLLSESAIWQYFGYGEEALHILEQAGIDTGSRIKAQLLYDTQRYREAEAVRGTSAEVMRKPMEGRQLSRLEPVEYTATAPPFPPPLSAAEMARASDALEQERDSYASVPFLARFNAQVVRWYRAGAPSAGFGTDTWEALGRDDAEKAVALHRFGILAARQGHMAVARESIARAVTYMPTSPILRRLHIALQGGAGDVVRKAAAACPNDSGVWLALLLTGVREAKPEHWFEEQIETAVANHTHCVESMVRAGDFLMRRGLIKPAVMAARYAQERGRSLLPAHFLALQCAMQTGNTEWALAAALKGVEAALDPAPLYETIVRLKSRQRARDTDLLTAFEFLRQHVPEDTRWAERLGMEYFNRGESKRALGVLTEALRSDLKSLRVHSLIAAAEAARAEGLPNQSVAILKAARVLYPEDVVVLNNLVYYLAINPDTLPDAQALLPALLSRRNDSFAVYDTAAMVYLQSGDVEEARKQVNKAVEGLDPDDYSALEIKLNAARVLFEGNDLDGAKRMVDDVRKNPACPVHLEAGIRELLGKIKSREEQLLRQK